jgi:hypothetical protein
MRGRFLPVTGRGFGRAALLLALLPVACGKGGGAPPTKTLHWVQPSANADGSPPDTSFDVSYFEIYVNTDNSFSDRDTPVGTIRALANGSIEPIGQCELNALTPHHPAGTYYVSVRSVGRNGQKSEFASAVTYVK